MLFVPLPDFDLELCNGVWPRDELERMNQSFVAAVEQAFANGGESRAAAAATVQIKSSLNGSRRLAAEAAIELGWKWLREKMAANVDVAAAEVVAFVQTHCAGISSAQIRAGFDRGFRAYWRTYLCKEEDHGAEVCERREAARSERSGARRTGVHRSVSVREVRTARSASESVRGDARQLPNESAT